MSAYKTDQRRVVYRGREFHFVSYEGLPADRNGSDPTPPSWFLMREGKRWMVMPQVPDQSDADLELLLHGWLDAHVFSSRPAALKVHHPARHEAAAPRKRA